jgi:hypothetical protein
MPATLLTFVLVVAVAVADPEVHRLWANLPEQRFIPYFALRVCHHIMKAAGVLIGGGLLPVVGRGQGFAATLARRS